MAIDPLTPQRRRERTRQHLIDAGGMVFSQRGYTGASLDEVAAAAGFTKGAVYSNFKNKEDLFVAVLEDRLQSQIRAIEDLLADDPRRAGEHVAAIRGLVAPRGDTDWMVLYLEFLVYAARNPEARAKLAAYRSRARDAIERLVTHEWTRLGSNPDIPARAVATISLALFSGLDFDRLIDPDAITEQTIDETLVFFLAAARGLGIDLDP